MARNDALMVLATCGCKIGIAAAKQLKTNELLVLVCCSNKNKQQKT